MAKSGMASHVKEITVTAILVGVVLVPVALPFITSFNWTALGVTAGSATGIALLAMAPILVVAILLKLLKQI